MAIVLQQPSFGETIGTGLGTGLSSGLQALAQHKMQEMQQRNVASALGQLIPQQQASALSQLPESLQQTYLKDVLAAPREQAYAQALGLGPTSGSQALSQELPGTESSLTAASPRLTERQATEIAKMRQAESRQASKEKSEAFKQTQKLREEIITSGRQARRNLDDLNRLQELEKEGLPSAGYNELLKRSGLDIPALKAGAGEEFDKIAANFISNARSIFGARISNFELESFLKTIPNLSQSPEGRKRVIANLKNINRINLEASNVMKNIIKENGGIPPLDLYERIDDKIALKADKFAKKFKKDLSQSVPEAQNRALTATQAIAGNIAPYLPGAALGTGIGALAGGPLGALVGAAGGAGLSGLSSLLTGLSGLSSSLKGLF